MTSRRLRVIDAQVAEKKPAALGKWRIGCKVGHDSLIPASPKPPSTPQDTLWGDIKRGLEQYTHYFKQADLWLNLEYRRPRSFKYPLRWPDGVEACQVLDNVTIEEYEYVSAAGRPYERRGKTKFHRIVRVERDGTIIFSEPEPLDSEKTSPATSQETTSPSRARTLLWGAVILCLALVMWIGTLQQPGSGPSRANAPSPTPPSIVGRSALIMSDGGTPYGHHLAATSLETWDELNNPRVRTHRAYATSVVEKLTAEDKIFDVFDGDLVTVIDQRGAYTKVVLKERAGGAQTEIGREGWIESSLLADPDKSPPVTAAVCRTWERLGNHAPGSGFSQQCTYSPDPSTGQGLYTLTLKGDYGDQHLYVAYALLAKLEEFDRPVAKASKVVMEFPDEKIMRGGAVSYGLQMADIRGCMKGATVGEPNDPGEVDRRLCVISLLTKSAQQASGSARSAPWQRTTTTLSPRKRAASR